MRKIAVVRILHGFGTFVLLAASLDPAAAATTRPREKAGVAPASQAQRATLWQRFVTEHGRGWSVAWNPVTGTPHRINGAALSIGEAVNRKNVERVTRRVLEANQDFLQTDPRALVLEHVEFDPSESGPSGGGLWYVFYRQVYRGIPVEGGAAHFILRDGKLIEMGSDYYRAVGARTTPDVPLAAAVATVGADVGENGLAPLSSELVIVPRTSDDRLFYDLAWKILTPVVRVPARAALAYEERAPAPVTGDARDFDSLLLPSQWIFLIDARTGEVLRRTNVMSSANISGKVTGDVLPLGPGDAPVNVDIAFQTVVVPRLPPLNDLSDDTDVNGNYDIGGLSPSTYEVKTTLGGRFVSVDDAAGPTASHSEPNVATPPGLHGWNWGFLDPSQDKVQTNVFHYVTQAHQFFSSGAPFDVVPIAEPTSVRVHDGPYCNAFAGLGGAGTNALSFGSGNGTCTDYGLCKDIIYHEYTHVITRIILAGATPAPSPEAALEFTALKEALSDYFAVSNTNEPDFGARCTFGRSLDSPDRRYLDDWVIEPHLFGMILGGALWDLRSALGATVADSLVMRAIKARPTSFSELLRASFVVDDDDFDLSNGTPHSTAICHAFYDLHGIYDPSCARRTQTPVAVIESPHPMLALDGSSPSVAIVGTALGSSSAALSSFRLEHAHESSPTAWSTAGITLAGGGSAPITSAELGTLDVGGLADGFHVVRLTVTDANGESASAQTSLLIDRSLLAGWPRAPLVGFLWGSPAVADIDPATPGQEIVANGGDSFTYAWHADGTPLSPGWPKYTGMLTSAPAVADLDGDGRLEIVISSYWPRVVWVFDAEGNRKWNWPQFCGGPKGGIYATPAIGDVAGDTKLEVVVGSLDQDGTLCAWRYDGSPVPGWPMKLGSPIATSAALGDLDFPLDGKREIVVGTRAGLVFALRYDRKPPLGTSLWPRAFPTEISASPALGDIAGDAALEVVFGTKDGEIRALHRTGHDLWSPPSRPTGSTLVDPASMTLTNLDGTGKLEVLAISVDDHIHAWDGNGNALAGWPPLTGPGYPFTVSSPVVGDLDADGDRDVLSEVSPQTKVGEWFLFGLSAYRRDGSTLPGWPRTITAFPSPDPPPLQFPWSINMTPAIADVDLDGHIDVVAGAQGIFVRKLPAAYDASKADWPFLRHDVLRKAAYDSPPTCVDGVTNGSETDIDCGGRCECACPPLGADPHVWYWCNPVVRLLCENEHCQSCEVGQHCTAGCDCKSGVCGGGKCSPPLCNDSVKNGQETDKDCGGPFCGKKCADGQTCSVGSDCQSGVCAGGTCQPPTCPDGVKNGKETDFDCGGFADGHCGCGWNLWCNVDRDCAPGLQCRGASATTMGHCKCAQTDFDFTVDSSVGTPAEGGEWPGGMQTLPKTPGVPSECLVTANLPDKTITLVCGLGAPFSVQSSGIGYQNCTGAGGEDGDGCGSFECHTPGGTPSCCFGRPSCTVGLNSGTRPAMSAGYHVVCTPK